MEKESFFEKVRQAGGRVTLTRREIIDFFCRKECLLTAADVEKYLNKKNIFADRSTIYREIVFLLNSKIIKQVNLGTDKKYYEIICDHHHHLICTLCHKITEVRLGDCLKKQENNLLKQKKFKVTGHILEFYGLCHKCK